MGMMGPRDGYVLTSIDISPTSSPPTRFMDMYGVECGLVRSRSLLQPQALIQDYIIHSYMLLCS